MAGKAEISAQSIQTQVDLNQKIREVIPWVISNYRSQPDKCREVSFCIVNELQQQPKVHAIKLLYINYYLCELIINYIDETDVMDFFVTIFPLPLKPVFKQFLGQLLSLSICLNNKQILNALAHYLEQRELTINASEIKCFPSKFPPYRFNHEVSKLTMTFLFCRSTPIRSDNLALHCPQFVTTLLNLGVYDDQTNQDDGDKLYSVDLLNDWLLGLNQSARSFQIQTESLMRYTLLGAGRNSSHLHYNLLELMQRGHCKPFAGSLLAQLAQRLSASSSTVDTIQTQKLLQFVIVALKQQLLLDFTLECKRTLAESFPGNQIAQMILNIS
jgi:hypothetical protein